MDRDNRIKAEVYDAKNDLRTKVVRLLDGDEYLDTLDIVVHWTIGKKWSTGSTDEELRSIHKGRLEIWSKFADKIIELVKGE